MQQYQQAFKRLAQDFNIRKGKYELLNSELVSIQAQTNELTQLYNSLQEEVKLLQATAQVAQSSVKSLIENLVTRGLQAIFHDRTYRFTITLGEERRAAVAEFNLEEFIGGEWRVRDFRSVGGGVSDVVSVLLRITAVVLRRPSQYRLLWLDEPFKHVWTGYQSGISLFLSKIAKELDLQIILTTHCLEVTKHADETWKASKVNGQCNLNKIPMPQGESNESA
jgi:DNA repair exonuclease SbcCD ATPase subunit